MCDKDNLARWAQGGMSRRGFGALGVAGAAAACAPNGAVPEAGGTGVTERAVSFATGQGTLDGLFIHPAKGRHPAVLFWPDIAGIREAKRQMARRLAREGYAVLLANPYYRDVAGEQFRDFADFAGNGGWDKVGPWRKRFSAETIQLDARAAAAWLHQQDSVDHARGMGTQGYCMTGSFAVLGAAASPDIKAAGSFHGGGLVNPASPASPHSSLEKSNRYLIAIARDDDAKAPGDKDALRAAADAAQCEAEIEVYPADHGWCVPDSPAYDEVQADKAWARLLALYSKL